MKAQLLTRFLLIAATSSCLLLPCGPLFGDELPGYGLDRTRTLDEPSTRHNKRNSRNESKRPGPVISDVVLDANGHLHGNFVDGTGQPLAGRLVVARQGRNQFQAAETNPNGTFELAGLNGGIWSVTVDSQSSLLRTWIHKTAPPAAKSRLLLVRKAPVVRAQSGGGLLTMFDSGTLFSVGAAITGTTLGIVGLTEASDANDDADSARAEAAAANDEAAALRDQLNALGAQPAGDTSPLDAAFQGSGDVNLLIDEPANTLN
jgi:hypothetical protein